MNDTTTKTSPQSVIERIVTSSVTYVVTIIAGLAASAVQYEFERYGQPVAGQVFEHRSEKFFAKEFNLFNAGLVSLDEGIQLEAVVPEPELAADQHSVKGVFPSGLRIEPVNTELISQRRGSETIISVTPMSGTKLTRLEPGSRIGLKLTANDEASLSRVKIQLHPAGNDPVDVSSDRPPLFRERFGRSVYMLGGGLVGSGLLGLILNHLRLVQSRRQIEIAAAVREATQLVTTACQDSLCAALRSVCSEMTATREADELERLAKLPKPEDVPASQSGVAKDAIKNKKPKPEPKTKARSDVPLSS
ncbi:hypothetical protein Pan44_53630 [Caulifigura coniformis]|uniref:Uncharacterized protein n=1 Tax=Caulifigura coniformis TaxID=2527983 RepID=A0A517SME5_9PLAN|nr:hypothetical protein [Caulifigura coniformis]QDT57295.1 hypothetical protein Pan44_53630 [Caulifigura coniformis]